MFPVPRTAFTTPSFWPQAVLPTRSSYVHQRAPEASPLCAMSTSDSDGLPGPQALIRRVVNQMRDPCTVAWAPQNIGSIRQWDSIDTLLSQLPADQELSQAYLLSQLDKQLQQFDTGPCGVLLKRDDVLPQNVFNQLKAQFGAVSEASPVHHILQKQLAKKEPVVILDQLSHTIFNHAIEDIYSRDFILNRVIRSHIKRSGEELPFGLLKFFISADYQLLPAVIRFLINSSSELVTDRIELLQQRLLEVRGRISSEPQFREALKRQKHHFDGEFMELLDDIATRQDAIASGEAVGPLDFDRYPNLSFDFCNKIVTHCEKLGLGLKGR